MKTRITDHSHTIKILEKFGNENETVITTEEIEQVISDLASEKNCGLCGFYT